MQNLNCLSNPTQLGTFLRFLKKVLLRGSRPRQLNADLLACSVSRIVTRSAFVVAVNSLGGLIGAGLFAGSGTAIAIAGPAIIPSYAFAGLALLWVRDFMVEMRRWAPSVLLLTDFIDVGLGTVTGSVARRIYVSPGAFLHS
jgi:hypothetical protein